MSHPIKLSIDPNYRLHTYPTLDIQIFGSADDTRKWMIEYTS